MDATGQTTRVVWDSLTSQVLAGNPLGDPVTRRLPVILPPGYDAAPDRRYPTIYALTGFTGRGTMLLNDSAWQPNLQERLDRLYAAGLPPVIVVLPDCFTRYGGSQYLNSTATGPYESYLVEEIIPYVDHHYRTLAGAPARGVFGKSSGGYGALMMGMRHPDLFSAVACHSGDLFFDLCYRPDFPAAANAIQKAGGLPAWIQAFEAKARKEGSDIAVMEVIAMAACYSPNPAAPLGFDLPFDLYTCVLRDAVWARWLAWDPIQMLDRYAEALRGLRLLFLDCGTRDEYNLHYGARRLVQLLQERGIAYEHEEFDDGHMNIPYRYDVSLPKIAAALQRS
ncbi:MAG TPA: alpha/beta hydrolase-fold protein [Chloroflexia bacterium]|nr:alpha/beta hydrolase-fold protein [Chloroflexia bacterium]